MEVKKDNSVELLITIITERMDRYGIDKEGVQRLRIILGSLCHKDSPDYYEHCVATLVPEIPSEGLQLKSLQKAYLDQVWLKMTKIWPVTLPEKLIPVFGSSFCEYVSCEMTNEKRTATHMEIVNQLLIERQDYSLETISNLLSLSYWVLLFFFRKERDNYHKRTYKEMKASHYFMTDLFVTFLALRCRMRPPSTSYDIDASAIPTLKETILHTGISPEDSVFQKLVLKEAIQILRINSQPGAVVQDLAEDIQRAFSEKLGVLTRSWKAKDAKRVLQIVKDQSRYMSLGSPDLRRNFVADKMRRKLSSVAKLLLDNHTEMRYLIERNGKDVDKALNIFREMDKITELDDGSCMPVLPPAGKFKSLKINLDSLHHLILVNISYDFLKEQCPDLEPNWWFKVDDFPDFLRCFALKVYQYAVTIMIDNYPAKPKILYQTVANLALSLQYMIALRWYVSETVQGFQNSPKINAELQKHQQVIFIMLAFRMLLLFLLPRDTKPYGLEEVAKDLPKYAKNLRIHVDLHTL